MTGYGLRAGLIVLVCLSLLALAPILAAAETVACVGDSITEIHIPGRLKSRLESATGSGWTVYDDGYGGYTTYDLRDLMASKCWWCSRPTYTLIMAGTNDMVHSYNINSSVGAMQDMVNLMRRGSSRVVVALIIPSLSAGETQWAKLYNQRLQERLSGVDYFMKTNWEEFYDENTAAANANYMEDRLHPNETGYDMIADNWTDVILTRQADPCTEKVNNYR
jgi:lysophospholipase L1-like esterase